MTIIQPSRNTFWRVIFLVSTLLPWLSIWQSVLLARGMEIDFIASASWMALFVGLFVLGLMSLLVWTLTWSRYQERILSFVESPEHLNLNAYWIGWFALVVSLVGYTAVFSVPFIQRLFGVDAWIRLLIFWLFSLSGLFAIKMLWRGRSWFIALLSIVLMQTVIHSLVSNFSYVTNYPFTMGWSETSRYYHPSFFISSLIYGREYPLPVLNPTLHLLLVPPYLIDAPLWTHRLWQVAARYLFLAFTTFVLLRRIFAKDLSTHLMIGIWAFLYLLYGPLYFHLTIPVILILIGYSSSNDGRTWLFLLLASAWCGWSRVNWYPVPAIIAAVMYVLDTPLKGRKILQYLIKPALWGFVGLLIAFAFQRIYILISGVENTNYFYTHLVSDLLWYRLLPNATLSTGILPAVIMFSLPMWLIIYIVMRARKDSVHAVRVLLLFLALFALLVVGVIVSLKIGGGADLHNMDAYFVVLLLVTVYLTFAKYQQEDGKPDSPISLHWALVVLLMMIPVGAQLRSNPGIITYDKNRTDAVLSALQERVDQANAQDDEILFITQRHLISMGMLHDVKLVFEYEREDLMEMAMGDNLEYLDTFKKDMDDQRFSIIVVDLLKFKYLGSDSSFGEENNIWVRKVMKPILCNYQVDVVFAEDDVALYVPQEGERQCPQP